MSEVFTTSYLRVNIIAWLPIRPEDEVLYVGAEEDVIAEKLTEMSKHVHFAAWEKGISCQGNYDYIINIGAAPAESAGMFIEYLKENGRLVLAAENAYGLKYLAGTKEIRSKEYFGGVEASEQSAGCTREELEASLKDAGYAWQKFYYPFPDHQFAMSIYSDDYLPKRGELIDQIGNFDTERLVLFDETKAADALIARGKFQEFSNSYLIVAGREQAEQIANDNGETISYVKFSNDRGKSHNIRTYITKSADGKQHLWKVPDTQAAAAQISNLKKTEQILSCLYADSRFSMNACEDHAAGAELAFLQGHTMEEELDSLLDEGGQEKAADRIFEVLEEIRSCKDMQEFQLTEGFQRVFGNPKLPAGLMAVPIGDIDMIMPNILVGAGDTWTVIDYEWSFHFPVPVNFILYRAIHYYADTTAKRRVLDSGKLYERAGITEAERSAYEEMEEAFQRYVLDGHIPMRQLYKEAGKPAYHISSVLHVVDDLERRRALQIYFDRGAGFHEGDTVFYHSKALDGTYHLEVPVAADVTKLRIDPGSQACTVEIERLAWKNGSQAVLDFISNGHKMAGNMYLFDTEDPNLLLEQLPAGEKTLLLDLRIESMSLAAAEWIAPKIDTKYKLKKMLKK